MDNDPPPDTVEDGPVGPAPPSPLVVSSLSHAPATRKKVATAAAPKEVNFVIAACL